MRTVILALLAACPGHTHDDHTFCYPTPIDSNADGVADGLDLDCDGLIDIPWFPRNNVTCENDGATRATCGTAETSCSTGVPNGGF